MGLIKVMEVVLAFLVGEYTMLMFVIWVSLVSLLLHFPQEPHLTPELSSGNVGMQKHFVPVLLHCIYNKTVWIWLSCNILGKLVTQPGGKQIY